MKLLKKGMEGDEVRQLQEILRELDYDVPLSGVFDQATYKAVQVFQSRHLDKHGVPLVVDGQVGPLTWWALQNPRSKVETGSTLYSEMPPDSMGGSFLGRNALQEAINEMNAGATEVGGNNRGPWVKKYLQPAGLGEGNPWCAAFVSWCFLQTVGEDKSDMPFRYSAGARNIFQQFKDKGWALDENATPEPGDIVCWWRISKPSGFGHIGIVHHCKDGFLYTIEGNKAANVAGFSYVKSRMDKLLGYGRIP
ncbi:MAG: CHAP domain-containing protein [Solitalea sp.]